MASRVSSHHNAVPISKLLAVEAQVGKLSSEMEKLILISTQHGMRIKELIVASTNSVSQVDMMSAVTTARFQHINDLKALRSNLQMKYEQSLPGAAEGLLADDSESKELKAMASRLFEVESEASNAKFKHGMELNKLKLELKDSKKEFDELRRFVSILESKLGSFIQDAKDNGIKTNIAMDDMPEITVFASNGSHRASILSTDNPLEEVGEEVASPDEPIELVVPDSAPPKELEMPLPAHNLSHSTINTDTTHLTQNTANAVLDPLHLPPTGIPPQSSAHHQHLHQLQQQAHLMHYHNQVSAHSSYSQIYGVPISDSGLSSHTASHLNLPQANSSSQYGGHPHYNPYTNHYPDEMFLVSNYGKPDLTREERYYKTQFKAVKELILASMECKDLATVEPEGLHATAMPESSVEDKNDGASAVGDDHMGAVSHKEELVDPAIAAGNATTAILTKSSPIHLRQRNRDFYYNLQKVKQVEKIALSYADFCVNNAVNVIDGAAYDKFQATMFEAELDRFHAKAATQQSVEVQTDIPTMNLAYPTSGFSSRNTSVNNSPNTDYIRKSSIFSSSGKLSAGRKRGDSFLLRSQSERVRTPNSNAPDAALLNTVRVSTSRQGTTQAEKSGFDETDEVHSDSVEVGSAKPDATDTAPVAPTTSVKSRTSTPNGTSGIEYTRARTPVDTSPKNMLAALKQLREEAAQEAEEEDDIAALAEMELPTSAPLIDFGDVLMPTLYSSTGRRQSLSLINPVKAQSFRDPALDFLDIQDVNDGENEDEPMKDTFGPGLLLASKTPSFRNSFKARKDFFSTRPGTGGSMKGNQEWGSNSSGNTPLFNSPQSIKHKTLSNNNLTKPASGIAFSDTLTSNVALSDEDAVEIKEDMKALMDKKLLALYTALDNRWQGLDSTNTSILQKLNRFQDVIVGINEDNQRILGLNQALAVKMTKVESRMYEALEPVYIALQHNRDGVENLEALMVDVAEKLQGLKENKAPPNAPLPKGMAPNPQLPIETILRGRTGATVPTKPGDYHIDEVLAPRVASAMSEYELESVFRQLREYSSLYKDMVHNYNHLMKRLKEDDSRRSGNFHLKKPHISGTVEVTEVVSELRLPNNNMEDACQADTTMETANPREPETLNSRFPQSYHSPHRVIVPVGKNSSSVVNKRDIQLCVEKSDLSTNIEIVRMKNDIARLSNALGIRDTSPSRQRGVLPPTTFPSLFSSLGNGEFTVLNTQQSSDGQTVLSYLPPTSPSGRVLRSRQTDGNGGVRGGAELNAQGLFVGSPGQNNRMQHRIPLEFSLNDELKSLSLSGDSYSKTDLTSMVPSVHNNNAVSVHAPRSVASVHELNASSHNSIAHTILSTPEGGYSIGGVEEDVGLDSHSLSPYEFLLNPRVPDGHEASETSNAGSIVDHVDNIRAAVSIDGSNKVITPGAAPARPSVAIIHAPADASPTANTSTATVHNPSRPKSRSVMWGSSANIRTNTNPLQRESSFKTAKLSSTSGKEPSNPCAITAASPALPKGKILTTSGTKTHDSGTYNADSVRKMNVIQRADEIISASQTATTDTISATINNVRTGMVPNPTPPVVSRPLHATQPGNAGAKNKTPRRAVTDKNISTSRDSAHTTTIDADVDTSAVWQYNPRGSHTAGSDVAATPSVLLQPGEYIPSNGLTDRHLAPLQHRLHDVVSHTENSLESDSVVGGAFVE